MSRLATWAPPIAWMAVVLAMSSAPFSAKTTGDFMHPLLTWLLPGLTPDHVALIHALTRKAAHVSEYAILAALWLRAFARTALRPATGAWLAVGLSVACAVVDETHQAFVPDRTGSAVDVLVDTLGVLVVVLLARLGWWRAAEATTDALLWIAAVGGALMLAIGVAAGTGSSVLWLTVPVTAAFLIYRRWRSGTTR